MRGNIVQENFKRYEKKYLLGGNQYTKFIEKTTEYLVPDKFGSYKISNLYLDTSDFYLIRTSLEKPIYKEKIRLRAYGENVPPQSTVYLELKKKYKSVVYKRRIELPLKDAEAYIYNTAYEVTDSQIFHEIDFAMNRYHPKPMVYISYDREAYATGSESDVRVTFDKNILGRSDNLSLTRNSYGTTIISEDQMLMEIKIQDAMPLWLSSLLSELEIFPASFSKYGRYYMQYNSLQKSK